MIHLRPSYIGFMVSVFVFCPIAGQSAEGSRNDSQNMQNVLQVRGLSAGAGEDDPGILYILPWQTPSLPTAVREPNSIKRHRNSCSRCPNAYWKTTGNFAKR